VNSGTFVVASPVDGPLGTFTQSAGVLQGNSSLTQSAVTINGGVLRPGAAGAPGTLTINGNLALGAGAVLEINATPAQTSSVAVSGAASVAGTVELVAGAGTYPETRQTILSATGGVTGTFSGVTTASAFLTPSLSYDPNSVFLSFYQTATFDSVAMTPNQAAVSTLLGTIQAGGGSADMQATIDTLSGLSAEQARAAYDSLAGAGAAAAAFSLQFDLAEGFARTLANRLGGAGSGGLTAMLPVQVASVGSGLDLTPSAKERGAWVLAYGNHGKTDGDANANGYRQDGAGVAFGADTAFGERWRAGAAVNIGTQLAKLDAGAGKATADGVSIAAYARYSAGAFTVDGMAGVGRNGNESTRTVEVGGISRTARTDFDSDQQFAHLELTMKGWRLEPVAGLGYIRVDSPSYTENGAGGVGLTVDGQARESVKSYVGVRSQFHLGASVKLTARALWSHEHGDADSALASARFTGAPAAGAFQTAGVDLDRDGVVLGVGLSGDWRRNLSLFGDLSVEARQGQWNAAVFAGARYAW
jgi:outer membrane autotransporter protein